MSDRTMALIRGANPYPDELPPLPIDPVMQRLAEDGPPQPATRRRIPLPNLGGVMAAISVAVALAIAAVALTALAPRHRTAVAGSSPIASSRQQLLRILGVLRRPQTKTDLLATRPELPGIFRVSTVRGACRGESSTLLPCTVRLDKPLVRQVRIGAGYSAAIFPAKIERSTARAQRGEGVVIALRAPGLYIITSMTPTPAGAARPRPVPLGVCRERR
jgi:hypothetical protein